MLDAAGKGDIWLFALYFFLGKIISVGSLYEGRKIPKLRDFLPSLNSALIIAAIQQRQTFRYVEKAQERSAFVKENAPYQTELFFGL